MEIDNKLRNYMKFDDSLREYMTRNRIIDHPDHGFCKLGDWIADAESRTITMTVTPIEIVFEIKSLS